jgi:NAD-dependent dihydropyrimidine dehydrogenase PreA subunit
MSATPAFRSSRCTHYRYRYSECSSCFDACPHEAIDLSDEGITIKTADCQNCSLCAAACPTEALVSENLQKVEVLKRTIKLTDVTFACAPSQATGDEIVPCLGGLDAPMLALLLSRGIKVSLAGTHHCAECPHGSRGRRMIDAQLEAIELLHSNVGNDQWSAVKLPEIIDSESPVTEHDPTRRHFFRRFVGYGTDQLVRAATDAEQQAVPLKADAKCCKSCLMPSRPNRPLYPRTRLFLSPG